MIRIQTTVCVYHVELKPETIHYGENRYIALRGDIKEIRGDVKELRNEMNLQFSEVRTELHSMNTRLSRVEGHMRISDGSTTP